MLRFLALATISFALHAQSFQGRPAFSLGNDRLQATLLETGGSVVSLILKDDPGQLNPFWTPERADSAAMGHFLCLDAFGPTSKEEQAAGLLFHGEAVRTRFEKLMQRSQDGVTTLTLSATLPLAHERVIRNYEMKQGENVLYVRTRVESQLGFDRPMVWAEDGILSSPFLERGVTFADISGSESRTRPYDKQGRRRLPSDKSFTWPNAPLAAGGTADLRPIPAAGVSMDHTGTLADRSRKWAWTTVVNTRRRLIVGWVWRTADFPWVQNWENYAENSLARGLEFATQPFDIPRREAVAMSPLFGVPTFRWLPAKSAVETAFALFYAPVPEGFGGVRALDVEEGRIVLTGTGGQRVVLAASLPFL